MALTDFFRVNLPYGLKKNEAGEWFVFNREYLPLGWNNEQRKSEFVGDGHFPGLPVQTKYKGLTDNAIRKIITDPARIQHDEEGKIKSFWLYNDGTNPMIDPKCWSAYLDKIKALSKFAIAN